MKAVLNPAIGDRFGKLVVTGAPVSRNGRYWPCKCDCGNDDGIFVSITSPKQRAASNGGCEKCYRVRHGHGSSSDATYSKYQAMKQRCTNPAHVAYENYGGRGITVCARWMNSFDAFLADMGTCPPGRTIERKDGNGNYESGNCTWATMQEQAENTRRNVKVSIDGSTYPTLKAAADAYGVSYPTVRVRVKTYGWSVEKALKTPIDTKKRPVTRMKEEAA